VLPVGGPESIKRYLTRADGTQVGGQALLEAMARMAAYFKPAERVSEAKEPSQSLAARMRDEQRMMAYQLADAVVTAPRA
jgi:hypothetical protein